QTRIGGIKRRHAIKTCGLVHLFTPLGSNPRGVFVSGGSMPIVADNIDTLILNVKLRQDFPLELAQQLDVLKEASQEAEEDLVTDFTFAGERLFVKPHGAGKQWRWILHSPSVHLDVGLGKHPQIVAKA